AAIERAQREGSGSIEEVEEVEVTADSTSRSEDLQLGDLEVVHQNGDKILGKCNTLQVDLKSEKSLPLMKLPPEIRNMIYEMVLFVADPIGIQLAWLSWYPSPRATHDGLRTIRHSPRKTCQLLQVCKEIYHEASLIYYRHNSFFCSGVEALGEFLTKLTIQQRRNIRCLSFHFNDGHAPAKSMRLLQGCVSSALTISFTRYTLPDYGLRMPDSLKCLPGLGDLLKPYHSINDEVNPEAFIEDLQVLKLPRSAASLRRQDDKDFPPEKARRTVFGQANAMTRSEQAMIDGNEGGQCSPGGIGHALALEFHAQGLRVFATARTTKAVQDLDDAGIEVLDLDVTSEKSISACKEEVAKRTGGRLDYLVNNAGRNYTVPAIEAEISEIEATFNTNLFAVMRLCQTFMPLLREAQGTIVQIGSVAAIIPYAWGSVYNASKAALHSYSDALRIEVAPLGVQVITIVTGGVKSRISRVSRSLAEESAYKMIEGAYQKRQMYSQSVGMDTKAYAQQVVGQVLRAKGWLWTTRKIWAGGGAELVMWLSWFLPERAIDRIVSRMFGFDEL
ncbi:MAG: hypothetical protein Q9192_006144, partial [Flavoplaca navasiana]